MPQRSADIRPRHHYELLFVAEVEIVLRGSVSFLINQPLTFHISRWESC